MNNCYRENVKLKHNFISTITKSTRTWADCDCCWHYDSWAYDLSCGHQICEYIELKEGDHVQCEDCYYDKNKIYIEDEYYEKYWRYISNEDEIYDKSILTNSNN